MSSGVILVIGVGGIGGPAAMALARAGAPPLRLVDPDVVETSNLPRQVCFASADVGQRKASVAARLLSDRRVSVEGIVERFDEATAPRLLRDVRVAIDATDGAATKDLVNALVVEAGIPLVHAAAIGSEARLLDSPAGGRPCIACLFGYPSESGDSAGDTCARVGVWPCVPGAIGALAAHRALRRIAQPAAPASRLQVLDFASPRAHAFRAALDPACPACGAARRRPRPVADACATKPEAFESVAAEGVLDLRLEHCPMNLFRARTAIDATKPGETLEMWLGGEGAETVPSGLSSLGHALVVAEPRANGLRIVVRRRGGARTSGEADPEWLRRFARQIVLPDFGEKGQRRISRAEVEVAGSSEAAEAAALHLRAAGVGSIERTASVVHHRLTLSPRGLPWAVDRRVRPAGPLSRFEGAVAADALLRSIVAGSIASACIDVSDEGVVSTGTSGDSPT